MLADSLQVVIGVDPGLSGAAWKIGRGYNQGVRDFKSIGDLVLGISGLCRTDPLPTSSVIEEVHAMPGQGVCSMFSFGLATGAAQSALILALPSGCPCQPVTPQKWQTFYRRLVKMPAKVKFDSRAIACRLFPDRAEWFSRVKDHNSADAALMAVWGLAQICGDLSLFR